MSETGKAGAFSPKEKARQDGCGGSQPALFAPRLCPPLRQAFSTWREKSSALSMSPRGSGRAHFTSACGGKADIARRADVR
jgi:hypothetical protein